MRTFPTKFILALLVYLFVSHPALAIESGKVSIYPTNFSESDPKTRSWFIYKLQPGQAQKGEVTVANKGSQPQVLEIYSVDATANKDGAFTLAEKGTKE